MCFPIVLLLCVVLTLVAVVANQHQPSSRWWPRIRRSTTATRPLVNDGESADNTNSNVTRFRRKPDWVLHEVLRLKALMPHNGVRRIAATFNRLHAGTGASVGKSFVADAIAANQYAILTLRRELRSRGPRPTKVNTTWAMDLSFHRDATQAPNNGRQQVIIGILDHGSRVVTRLAVVVNRKSWTLLGHLCLAIAHHGKPKRLRTDNEAIFTSFTFRAFLWLAGIGHQRIDTCAPWQNGRIERLFGSLKPLLRQLAIPSSAALHAALDEFRLFHNHVQPHQNLQGETPAEVWNATSARSTQANKSSPVFVEAMNGLLAGFYIPP